jgi:sugar lactone lactonase YvrE
MTRVCQKVFTATILAGAAALFGCEGAGTTGDGSAADLHPAGGEALCCAGGHAAEEASPLKAAELLVTLPTEHVNTPDAMCLMPDGNVILSVPNFNDLSQQPLLMKITPENRAEVFYMLPDHPETGEPFGSLGVCLAPDGDLFVADYQMTADGMGRVVRILIEDGQAVGSRAVITGFNIPNAVIVRGDSLYVSDTQLDATTQPAISGVFRFALADLEGDEPLRLAENLLEDSHLLAAIETHDETLPLGADGLCFDKAGNLYIGNFADGTVHRFEFDGAGAVVSNTIFARADYMKSADGLFMDPVTDVIYVADSRANAVQMVYPDGSVKTLAQNGDTDGADGGMDQPCEVLLRGRELIVSNMDWPVPGTINSGHEEPHTLSVIR